MEDISQSAANAIAALSPRGKETFRKATDAVRQEAFYRDFLSSGQVEMTPDESACVRYGGYTQTVQEQEPLPGARMAKRRHYLVHLCKKIVESGNVAEVEGIIAHELAHAFVKEFAGEEAATLISRPVLREIAEQLARLPQYKGMEKVLSQFLFEQLGGYSEAEIFVGLQELPHHMKLIERDRLLGWVFCELRRLDASGFPPRIRNVLVRELKLRTEFFYDQRIRQESGARAKRLSDLKVYAMRILEMALSLRQLEQLGEQLPYEIHCGE